MSIRCGAVSGGLGRAAAVIESSEAGLRFRRSQGFSARRWVSGISEIDFAKAGKLSREVLGGAPPRKQSHYEGK